MESDIDNMFKVNHNTSAFHSHDICGSGGNGKRFIVTKMIGINYKNNTELYDKTTKTEIDFQICMARFVPKLPRSLQREFGEVMDYICKIFVKKEIDPICHVPEHYSDLRRMYVDGDNSIARQLPIPVVEFKSEHSVVSILDIVADFILKHDNLITDIYNYDNIINNYVTSNDMHIFKTRRVNEIIDTAKTRLTNATNQQLGILPLFITFWSDDFDPNKSIKNNRQSVWIKTMTIFTISLIGEKISSTYPLTLSMKGLDHDIVEQYYMRQLLSLREGELIKMYSRSHNRVIHVHADIFCVMNDQPERRGNLHLINGNSMIHGRFGILMDCKQVQNGIRSCISCTKSILEEAMTTIQRKSMYIHHVLY
jgi:hypothetical protein